LIRPHLQFAGSPDVFLRYLLQPQPGVHIPTVRRPKRLFPGSALRLAGAAVTIRMRAGATAPATLSRPVPEDQRTRSVLRVPRHTALNCNPNCNLQIRSKISAVQISLLLPDWPASRGCGRRPGPAVSGVVTSAVSKSVSKISEFDASPVRVRPAALTGCRTDTLDRRLGRSAWEAYAERTSGRRR
jgi:hypothetical protein